MTNFNTDEYIQTTESLLKSLMEEWRPKLMASHGKVEFSHKADKSVVTELDLSFEIAIKNVLRPISDQVGFIGEEHGSEGPQDTFWFVDPIDGTQQYIRGMTGCRTYLCLISDGKPIYVFAYRFTTGDLFTAQAGKGTMKNGQRIILHERELKDCWIEAAIDFQQPHLVDAMVRVDKLVHAVVYTKEFLNVVEGFVDGYLVLGGKGHTWDYAPRALLLQEVGMKVTNAGSDHYDYKVLSIVATHPAIHDKVSNALSLEP